MRKVFLVGHTGSVNRGCEAIVRSTIKLLKKNGITNIILGTSDIKSDINSQINTICELMGTREISNKSFEGVLGGIERRLLKRYNYTEYCRNKNIIKRIDPEDIVFVIGGDTYCYQEPPYNAYMFNKYAKRKGAKTVLWACSIEKELINERMMEDFERYDYIAPRDAISEATLINQGINRSKIVSCSDPAFSLEIKRPKECHSLSKGTVGINLSPIIYKKKGLFLSIVDFIQLLLTETDKSVLLIPHVYKDNKLDSEVIEKVKMCFENCDRVTSVTEALNCEEIKYYIGMCEAFIGCRTHSTIAAYSQCIPTFVIGYSVKSKGIATDIFGSYDKYVESFDCIDSGRQLYDLFFDNILNNREELKKTMETTIPQYRTKAEEAMKIVLRY